MTVAGPAGHPTLAEVQVVAPPREDPSWSATDCDSAPCEDFDAVPVHTIIKYIVSHTHSLDTMVAYRIPLFDKGHVPSKVQIE
jgi:hypothetical protein